MFEKIPSRMNNYEIRIPPNATPEDIDKFMVEFKKYWFKKTGQTSEPASKPEEDSSQSS